MRLTRRDAVLALAVGAGSGAVGLSDLFESREQAPTGSADVSEAQLDTLVAVADVVYPSAVAGVRAFVDEYVSGLPDSRTASVTAVADELNAYTRRERGTDFARLGVGERDSVLRSMGVDRTGSSRDGPLPDRVRFYVVNQLLFGLYTSPTGSTLLGIDNPVGHPGGFESYQEPPADVAQGDDRGLLRETDDE